MAIMMRTPKNRLLLNLSDCNDIPAAGMKDINERFQYPGQALGKEASHPFPSKGRGISPYVPGTRSGMNQHTASAPLASLGNTMDSLLPILLQ